MIINNIIALGIFETFWNGNVDVMEDTRLSHAMTMNFGEKSCPSKIESLHLIINSNQWMGVEL